MISPAPVWYYAEEGLPVGPLTLPDLKQQLARLPDAQNRFVWRDGWVNWERAGDFAELRPPAPRWARAGAGRLDKLTYGVGAVLAALLGVAIGLQTAREFGLRFWIPVICLSVSFLVVRAMKVPPSLAPVLGVSAGQWLRFLTAIALLLIFGIDQTLSWQLIGEGALLGVLVFWLWFARSSGAIIALAIYEVLGVAINGYTIAADGSSVSLAVQIVLQLCALVGAYYALSSSPAERRTAPAAASPQR